MNYEAVLEGMLFVVGDDGLTINQIKDVLELDDEEAKKLMVEGSVDVSGSTVKVDSSEELNNLA